MASLLMLAGTAALNWSVNPYGLYPTQWMQPLVQTSRSQKVELLEQLSEPPTGLILGSSRVLKLEPDYLETMTGEEFFNAGVNHGKIEDFLALFRFYKSHFGRAPKTVVLGLDVAAFSDATAFDGRLLNQPQLTRQIAEHIKWEERAKQWTDLIGWNQTKSSLSSLAYTLQGGFPDPIEVFRNDGVIEYLQRAEQMANGTYDFDGALAYTQREYRSQFRHFEKLSPQRRLMFREFLDECHVAGTQLYVFLTPLHPELAASLRRETKYSERLEGVRKYVLAQREHYEFQFSDFVEIESFAGKATQFVDGVHPMESNTRRMMDHLFEPTAVERIRHVSRDADYGASKETSDVVQ